MLRGRLRIGAGKNSPDFRLRLVVFDDSGSTAQVVTNQMRHQLHEGLAVTQDFRFQRVR